MRKWLKMLLLAGVFTVLLCGSALAAGERGICDVSPVSGTRLTPQTAGQDNVTPQLVGGKQVYLNAERIGMGYGGAVAGKEYLVFVLENGTAPTADNIVYIDQKSGMEAGTFDLYPSRLTGGKTYNVYVSSSSDGLTKVGSFGYYADYMLGDVTGDGTIDVFDVSEVLLYTVKKVELTGNRFLAADVTKDGNVNIDDLSDILLYTVKKITSFD